MTGFSIMNNTPFHFVFSALELAAFLGALLVKEDKTKERFVLAMKIVFALVLISGVVVWFLVPFSAALLVKSVGGIVLFWVMLQIVEEPQSVLYWALFIGIAVVGLGLAFFYI